MLKKILIIGPFPKPVSGVSLANKVIAGGLISKNWIVSTINTEQSSSVSEKHGSISFSKLKFIKAYLLAYKVFSAELIYITVGQTFFGVLKYAPIIYLGKIKRKKLVLHLHGNHLLNEYNGLTKIKKWIFKNLLASFDYGIVLSKSLRNNLLPFMPSENIFELMNFFQNDLAIGLAELQETKNFNTLRVVYLSNLIEEKGINVLLEAIRLLEDKRIPIEVIIAGSMTQENDLSKYFSKLKSVIYKGVVYGGEKKELLLWSNVFCLPTYYKMEGQPISIIEAMATGNLILTTRHAGILDICGDENAVFCEKKDASDLAKKLEFLSKNLKIVETKALHNFEYTNSIFTEDNFISNADKILEKCIG